MNLESISREMILNTTVAQPEKIFSGTELELKKIYKKLSLLWHPDKQSDGKNTNEIFTHIHDLYQSALKKARDGTLGTSLHALNITSVEGSQFVFRYKKQKKFEMGNYYIANSFVLWVFNKDFMKEIKESMTNLRKISYADDKMKSAFSKYIPEIHKEIETKEEYILVLKKPESFLNLGDILSYYKKMPARHTAWIMSRLYNLACFLNFNKIMHGSINLDNCFINPETHEVMLLGGWWYSKGEGEKLSMLAKEAYDIAPVSLMNTKKAQMMLDLALIRKLGRILSGDVSGNNLKNDKDIPSAMAEWLRSVHSGNAVEQYTEWYNEILEKSFGERKFVEMKVKAEDLYI